VGAGPAGATQVRVLLVDEAAVAVRLLGAKLAAELKVLPDWVMLSVKNAAVAFAPAEP